MSSLDSLIRLHRWQLDEQRRRVAELEALAAKLRAELQRLDQDHLGEQRIVVDSPEAAYAYSGYAKAMNERRRKLSESLANTDQQTVAARVALGDAFQEVKRYRDRRGQSLVEPTPPAPTPSAARHGRVRDRGLPSQDRARGLNRARRLDADFHVLSEARERRHGELRGGDEADVADQGHRG